MTVAELIEELSEYDPDMTVACSVNCDLEDSHDGRRVFGNDCRGVNPYFDEAVILFDFESVNFGGVLQNPKPRKKG